MVLFHWQLLRGPCIEEANQTSDACQSEPELWHYQWDANLQPHIVLRRFAARLLPRALNTCLIETCCLPFCVATHSWWTVGYIVASKFESMESTNDTEV